jgi:D-arabinose 1-dehydrogenase-like Zn-dependent alcohol dehydrogenase
LVSRAPARCHRSARTSSNPRRAHPAAGKVARSYPRIAAALHKVLQLIMRRRTIAGSMIGDIPETQWMNRA